METLLISLSLLFSVTAGAQAQETPQTPMPTEPDKAPLSLVTHACTPHVGYYEARYIREGDARLKLTLFGLLFKSADGTTRKGSPQIVLPFDEGGRPSGEAYIIANGQIEQMNLAEFADRYPTPCTFFGGVLT